MLIRTDCMHSRIGSQESPGVAWPLTRWVAETTLGRGAGYGGAGWCRICSWDGENTSPRCGEALGRCWQQKRLPGREWEMTFGLFCGSPLDIIGDGECMGSWFGLGAVRVTVGC